MHPQLRSIPVNKFESPQFSWNIKYNSRDPTDSSPQDYDVNVDRNNGLTDGTCASCYTQQSADPSLRPTLFPHPATCVCSSSLRPPKDTRYSYRKMKMDDQTIGELIEDSIVENYPTPPTPPIPISQRIVKKIFRCAHVPEDPNTNEEACIEYLTQDPSLLKELMVKMKPDRNLDLTTPRDHKKSSPGRQTGSRKNYELCKNCNRLKDKKEECKNDGFCTCKAVQEVEKQIEVEDNTKPTKKKEKKSPSSSPKKKGKDKNTSRKKKKETNQTTVATCEIYRNNPLEYIEEDDEEESEPDEDTEDIKLIYDNEMNNTKLSTEISNETCDSLERHAEAIQKQKQMTKLKRQQDVFNRPPWNFQNQPKPLDIMERFKRFDSSKTSDFGNGFMRSRAGDDLKSPGNGAGGDANKPNENVEKQRKHEKKKVKHEGMIRRMKPKHWHEMLEKQAIALAEKEAKKNGKNLTEIENHPSIEEFKIIVDRKKCLRCLMNELQEKFLGSRASIVACEKHKDENEGKVELEEDQKEHKIEIFRSKHSFESIDHCEKHNKNCENEQKMEHQEHKRGIVRPKSAFEESEEPKKHHQEHTIGFVRPKSALEEPVEQKKYQQEHKTEFVRPKSAFESSPYPKCMRPKSASFPVETDETSTPYFTVIRQKIHSRHRNLNDSSNQIKCRNENANILERSPQHLQDIPEHTCVHRFTVDERLFPKPLHSDDFGNSCCIHCDRPMKNEKTVFLDQRESKKNFEDNDNERITKKISKFSLRPKPVHIGTQNGLMEILLKPEQQEELLKKNNNEKDYVSKNFFHPDSLALRHRRR